MKPPAPRLSQLRTVKDVAAVLELSEKTVRRLVDRRELVAHRVGRAVRVSEEDLDVFLSRRRG